MKNEIILNGELFSYDIVRKRNRHTYLRIKGDHELLVTTNARTPIHAIRDFIVRNQNQILQHSQKRIPFFSFDDETISLFGETYLLYKIKASRNKIRVVHHNIYVEYTIEENVKVLLLKLAQQFVVNEAKQIILNENETLSKYMDLSNLSLKSMKMKSQFGSCHTVKKVINLNAYLAFFNRTYLHAILMHECAHLVVSGHQKDFYNLLYKLEPNYAEIHKEIKHKFMLYEV